MSRLAIVGGRVVLPDRVEEGLALVIEDGLIRGVTPSGSLSEEIEREDVGGRLVAPGLVDIHVHGAAGYGFDDPTASSHAAVAAALLVSGVTSCFAGIATGPLDQMVQSIAVVRAGLGVSGSGARILGAYLEGPYLAQEQRGAHDPALLRLPVDGSSDRLLEDIGAIGMVTLAPELPGAMDLIERLVTAGVVVALGHSAADEPTVRCAIERGARHMTHLWSGQSTTTRRGPWRVPGLLEVSLEEENVTAEMIADGRHLPARLMRLARKCIPPERLCLVSDASPGAGLPEGTRLDVDGLPAEISSGVAILVDGTSFAGSTTLLGRMVAIAREEAGADLADAIRMASLTPAQVAGVADRVGSLEAGKAADVVIFGDDMRPWRMMLEGRWIEASGIAPAGDAASTSVVT